MSKSRKRIDENQGSLFELIEQINAPKPEKSPPGRFRIIEDLRDSIRVAIKECRTLSRHQIAGEMSHLLDETITKAQIDSWTRETVTNEHGASVPNNRHIPAQYLPAFCDVTRCDEPLRVMVMKMEYHLMPPKKVLEAEVQKAKRRLSEDRKLVNRLETLLYEVEKR